MLKGDLSGLMQQAKKMQDQMQKAQEEISNLEVVGEAGAGLVKIMMTGRHDVKSVSLDDALMKEEKDIIEDLLAAAVNDAVRKIEAKNKEKMSGLTAGMPLPPGFKLPF